MPALNVLVIYSQSQLVRRRTVVMDGEEETDAMYQMHVKQMLPGEGYVFISMGQYLTFKTGDEFDAYLATLIGEPLSDACAVVSSDGDIIHTCCADPRIDDHPDGWVIQDDNAVVGEKYDFETANEEKPAEDEFKPSAKEIEIERARMERNQKELG